MKWTRTPGYCQDHTNTFYIYVEEELLVRPSFQMLNIFLIIDQPNFRIHQSLR